MVDQLDIVSLEDGRKIQIDKSGILAMGEDIVPLKKGTDRLFFKIQNDYMIFAIYKNGLMYVVDADYYYESANGYFDRYLNSIQGRPADYGNQNGNIMRILRFNRLDEYMAVISTFYFIYICMGDCLFDNNKLTVNGKECVILKVNSGIHLAPYSDAEFHKMTEYSIDKTKYTLDVDICEDSLLVYSEILINAKTGNRVYLKNINPVKYTKPALPDGAL
jgi:hypothetical protein